MGKFNFIPDYIESVVLAGCEIASAECLHIEKRGSNSVYVATVKRVDVTCEIVIPYDFGLMRPEAERPSLFAEIVNKALPSLVVAVEQPETDIETKPRKRRKGSEE